MLGRNRYCAVCACVRSYYTRQNNCCGAVVTKRFKSSVFEPIFYENLTRMSGQKRSASSCQRGNHIGPPPKHNMPQSQNPREPPQEIANKVAPLTHKEYSQDYTRIHAIAF